LIYEWQPLIFSFALTVKKSPGSPPSKKRKGKPGTDVSPRPVLKDWPEIALKSITDVTLDILKRLVSCSSPFSVATRWSSLTYLYIYFFAESP
jgi:hypothetical protein